MYNECEMGKVNGHLERMGRFYRKESTKRGY